MNTCKFGIANKGYIFKDNKLLIIYKTEEEAANDPNPKVRIDQPGGRLEYGESPYDSLLREINEEVGINAEIIKPFDIWYFVRADECFQLVGINYLCKWISGEVVLGKEHNKYEWITLEEIKNKDLIDIEQYLSAFDEWKKYNERK